MKILKNLGRSMICVAAGLLLYCGSFYIKSYEQNMAKQLKIRIQKTAPDKAEKNQTQKRRKII